jgi:imidazolonepropionase-like amidohydrolase
MKPALASVLATALLAGAPLHAESVALTGARIHTAGPEGTIENGTVILRDGRIAALGVGLAPPGDARVIDASGKEITPGYYDAHGFLGSVIHLGGVEDFVVSRNVALYVNLGEAGASASGGSRSMALLQFREVLEDARDLAAHRRAWEGGARRPYSASRPDLEALAETLRTGRPVVVTAHRSSDIEAALRLAEEFGLRLVVSGGSEAWLVAERLAAAGVPVIIDPLQNLPRRFEMLGATLENAARLHAAGVTVAFSTFASHNARNMRQAAGNAVAHGMPWDAALAALTANPARMFGEHERSGSLAPGKDADLAVWDGDPLEVTTTAERVFIRGREIPMVSRHTLLRERYREIGALLPPQFRSGDGQ